MRTNGSQFKPVALLLIEVKHDKDHQAASRAERDRTNGQILLEPGINADTFYKWKLNYPDFSDRLAIA